MRRWVYKTKDLGNELGTKLPLKALHDRHPIHFHCTCSAVKILLILQEAMIYSPPPPISVAHHLSYVKL